MAGCINCGEDCIELTRPICIPFYECCPGKCVTTIALKENTVYPAGSVVVEIKGTTTGVGARPGVFAPFDSTATDGTNLAHDAVIIPCDTATDDEGKIINRSYLPGRCQESMIPAYLCGRWGRGIIKGDIAALRAAGLDITTINGEVFLRGGS